VLTFLGIELLGGNWASANDTVVVRSEPASKERRITGSVVEYTGESLLVQHASGREEKVPSDQVVEVLGNWKESHKAANALFADGNFEAAEAKYREALRDEDRRWAKRRVLSQLTWCYRYLGQTDDAVKAFLPLCQDDPKTPYFVSIPLTWTSSPAEVDLERQAATWMQDQDSPAARLIGASWLLTSARRAEAINVLRQFASNPDPRIVFLAEAQQWRTQVATSHAEDTGRWQERIERMPPIIRGGPYYVLGLALSRHEMHEKAAISFMRTAILHSSERDLVPDALLAAARELETMEQAAEATGLYREILTKYETDRVATEAEARLKQLADGN
jgi:tetratricopeptide (TPR) repeat protein